MIDILVIGGAPLDVLHFGGKTVHSAGGAGLYTSAAAARAGVHAAMFALATGTDAGRPPTGAVAHRVVWPDRAARPAAPLRDRSLRQRRAELVNARWGAEAQLSSAGPLADLSPVAFVHGSAGNDRAPG